MAAHVADLCSRGMIGDDMAVELLRPSSNPTYSSHYLASHPDHTSEQPEMTSLVTAERHRAKRDKEMEQFLEDFKAGRIDEWANATAPKPTAGTEQPAVEEHCIDLVAVTIGHNESDDESSELTDASVSQMQLEKPEASPHKTSLPESSAPAPASEPGSATIPPKTQTRRQEIKSEPLKHSPGALDYSGFKYGELVAECRRRKILGDGSSQTVRNRLIQDNINARQSLPRAFIGYKGNLRDSHKHRTLAAMQGAVE
ncbi:uncharacterized protein EKO05_0007719 [Ascochyta rabiei]|nr:uncharacterized protein EKO05_0007719 [Ascochyta rabiei]UPX17357.1 hypothetical protein EKO05_0007719 [Ascochyta rabiei]